MVEGKKEICSLDFGFRAFGGRIHIMVFPSKLVVKKKV